MKWSKSFIVTQRENPRDAEIVSHQLMSRANFIRKHAAGIYSYLPLLVRSYHKLSGIIRDELDSIGWQEVICPFVIPAELWKETGRWSIFEGLMLQFKDRKDNEFCLGPTHEEVVTDLVRSQVTSYKQLPLTLYQIAPKFRDETRPRFGLMRGREFVMMDGYSFHVSKDDLDKHYDEVDGAYRRIFDRSGLKYARVEADTGAIGGSGSHEFQVLAQSGEDAILSCGTCGYAANVEKAETPKPDRQKRDWGKPTKESVTEVSTPTQKTIEAVSAFLNVPTNQNLKTLAYRYNTPTEPKVFKPVVVFVLGNRQLNEVKLKARLSERGLNPLELSPLPEAEVAKLFNSPVGFLGPIGSPASALTLYDRELLGAHDLVSGANKDGFHVKHLEPWRDLKLSDDNVTDIVNAVAGDSCARCERGIYESHRGIEVGHIFKLGDRYSKAMNAAFTDDAKQTRVIEMGTYGIGVTRILAACIEQNHDTDGMIWPESIAPYRVLVANLSVTDPAVTAAAEAIYAELRLRGIDVIYDDRDISPGVKFKDADLIGFPRRIVVGKKSLDSGQVEFSLRKDKVKRLLPLTSVQPDAVKALVDEAMRAS